MIFNLCAYWNETRGIVFKKKNTPIYYSMLFNLCAYWNQTRWTDFKKIQLMTICYWTHVRNETRGSVFQKHTNYYCMLFNLCAYWNETRGIVFKKKQHQFITLCYSTCVHIEIKQDGQISKKSNWWQYATELVCEMNREGQFSKNTQIITVCYSTCVRIEMKQEG